MRYLSMTADLISEMVHEIVADVDEFDDAVIDGISGGETVYTRYKGA